MLGGSKRRVKWTTASLRVVARNFDQTGISRGGSVALKAWRAAR